jgi:hypothetical protein
LAQLQPGAPPDGATADAGVMALRQEVLRHQRGAAARLRPLKASQPQLWASVLSQLARDEGAAGGEVHALVAAGRGGEEAIKRGADLLGRAQAPHLRC